MVPFTSQAQRGNGHAPTAQFGRLRPVAESWDESVNYYHFGNALADLFDFARSFAGRKALGRRAVDAYLERQHWPASRRDALLDILTAMAGPRGRLALPRVEHTLEQGQRWRERFQALGCRGFSFRLSTDARFHSCGGLSFENTLKVALLADADLYYPPLVRQALQRLSRTKQHVLGAIGWMLGQEWQVEGRTWWFVTNVQSDLTRHSLSCLRELFRGWQRVLFWLLLGLARRREVAVIAIPPAEALADSSAVGPAGGQRLEAWRPLYDGLASSFAMQLQDRMSPINVQPMQFLPAQPCSTFYVGAVDQLWNRFGTVPECPDSLPALAGHCSSETVRSERAN
jgi:hypothetical protein